MNQQSQQSLIDLNQVEYDSKMRPWSEAQLIDAVREVAVKARGEKESAFVLSSENETTRDAMRKELMLQLGSYWRNVENNAALEASNIKSNAVWWQVSLPNGSIIRISSEPKEPCA